MLTHHQAHHATATSLIQGCQVHEGQPMFTTFYEGAQPGCYVSFFEGQGKHQVELRERTSIHELERAIDYFGSRVYYNMCLYQ